ncbi:hypothetical protein TNCV_2578491 [Trichonephila clavipes]|nr:hypothetical protein TNCV_2578491 [Trichonephila clavipes]
MTRFEDHNTEGYCTLHGRVHVCTEERFSASADLKRTTHNLQQCNKYNIVERYNYGFGLGSILMVALIRMCFMEELTGVKYWDENLNLCVFSRLWL